MICEFYLNKAAIENGKVNGILRGGRVESQGERWKDSTNQTSLCAGV